MRISDWSSDVCSSDLPDTRALDRSPARARLGHHHAVRRMHAVSGDRATGAQLDGTVRTLGGALQDATCGQSECTFRHRPGRHAYATTSRSEEHTSELQSLMRNSYAVLCLKKNK